MIEDLLTAVAESAWALPLLFLLVVGDAFLVVVPGETAVTAFGALAASTGSPSLLGVIAVAAIAAFVGDACLYVIGRRVGLGRWRWMRHPRAQGLFEWARRRLAQRTAAVVFTARFVPYARLVVTLTAGATRVSAPRFLAVAAGAASAWAVYQAVIGAVIALVLPGGTVTAVVVSIVVALAIGVALDALLGRRVAAPGGAAEGDS